MSVSANSAVGSGGYDPSSVEGQHELAHVGQQTAGAVSMLPQEGELRIDPDERLEREAEETAERVLSSDGLGIRRMSDTGFHVQRARKNSGETAVLASNLQDTIDLKDRVSTLDEQVQSNTSEIEALNQTVDEALQTPDLSEIEGGLTTEDGGLADDALTHLTELNKAQAGMAGGAVTTAGVATGNPVLAGAGLSIALGGPVALNALEQESTGGESVALSGKFLDPLADAVAKRLDKRELANGNDPYSGGNQS